MWSPAAPMANKGATVQCPAVPLPYTGTVGQVVLTNKSARDRVWDTNETADRRAAVDRHSERDAWGDSIWDTSCSLRYITVPLSYSLAVGHWDSWRGTDTHHSICAECCPLSRCFA